MGECAILIGPLKRWNPFLQFILNSWQFFITLKNSLDYFSFQQARMMVIGCFLTMTNLFLLLRHTSGFLSCLNSRSGLQRKNGRSFVHPDREKFLIISNFFYVNGATWVNNQPILGRKLQTKNKVSYLSLFDRKAYSPRLSPYHFCESRADVTPFLLLLERIKKLKNL